MRNNYDNNTDAFLALLRAGLWEQRIQLLPFSPVDFSVILQLAEGQAVVGLIAAGLEHISDLKISKQDSLQFVGQTLQLEQRNTAMNSFIGVLVDKMADNGIYTLLVKGQGVAQCYERPLWRSCGDVDLFFDSDNYEKAKSFLIPLATSNERESVIVKHLGMTFNPWIVELHGTLYGGLSVKIDRLLDDIQFDCFCKGGVRIWQNGGSNVFLPNPNNDVIIIFSHILQHFYKGGIGLRQVCDWCRLLWTFRAGMDRRLLESRIRKMRLMSEWKAFASLAVDYLGMPPDAMPFYSSAEKWSRKAGRILSFILQVGNFGHNRVHSDFRKCPYLVRKSLSFGRRCKDLFSHAHVFPLDSVRFLPYIVYNGLRSAVHGK